MIDHERERERRAYRVVLLLLFSRVQDIVRTYDGRQSCMWSTEKGNQYIRHIFKHTTPSRLFIQL